MKNMPKMTLLIFVVLCVICLMLVTKIFDKNDTIIELTNEIEAYKNVEKLSDNGKKFILSYAKGSQEYKKYISDDDFYVNGEKAIGEEEPENHDSYGDEIKVNYLLSNTVYSKQGYETNILYELIELSEGYEMGVVLFKATLTWDDENKINNVNIELVS